MSATRRTIASTSSGTIVPPDPPRRSQGMSRAPVDNDRGRAVGSRVVMEGEPSQAGSASEDGIAYLDLARVSAPACEEFLRQYVHARRPVVLTGMADGWRARHDWSPEYLADAFGETAATAAP